MCDRVVQKRPETPKMEKRKGGLMKKVLLAILFICLFAVLLRFVVKADGDFFLIAVEKMEEMRVQCEETFAQEQLTQMDVIALYSWSHMGIDYTVSAVINCDTKEQFAVIYPYILYFTGVEAVAIGIMVQDQVAINVGVGLIGRVNQLLEARAEENEQPP